MSKSCDVGKVVNTFSLLTAYCISANDELMMHSSGDMICDATMYETDKCSFYSTHTHIMNT